jgi:hypothetical protein
MPKIAKYVIEQSTASARTQLEHAGALGLLVDNTVLYHAVTHETAWVSTGPSKWGPHTIDTGYAARIPVHDVSSDSREHQNVRYLPGLAHLCRSGHLALYTSAELRDEQFRQPGGRYRGYGFSDHSVLAALDIPSIDGFVFPHMGPPWMNLPSAEAQQRERLENHQSDPAYAALVQQLGPKNSQDAWHIYTAEKHGLFAFLTMDFKLVRNFEAQQHGYPLRTFRTKVMTPVQFAESIGLKPVNTALLSYDDAPFMVRPDLNMPGSKRRMRNQYKRP